MKKKIIAKMKTLKPTIQAVIVIIPGKIKIENAVGSFIVLRNNIVQLRYNLDDSPVEQFNTVLHEFVHIAAYLFNIGLSEKIVSVIANTITGEKEKNNGTKA